MIYGIVYRDDMGTSNYLVHCKFNLRAKMIDANLDNPKPLRAEKVLNAALGYPFDFDEGEIVEIREIGENETYILTEEMFDNALNELKE